MSQGRNCSSQQFLWLVASILSVLAFGSAAPSCILSDSRCDAHQRQYDLGLHTCVCEAGYVLSPRGYGCVPCGKNEEPKNDECVCKSGFTRASATADCEEVAGSVLGAECDAEKPCNDPNPYCAESEESPYCTTRGCTRNDDCPMDWRCGTAGDERFCQKPPPGFGMPCQSSADCAGTEATFCETLQTHMCIVSNCAGHPSDCPSQSSCCDLTALIGTSLCVTNAALSGGKCPGGSDPVAP